MNLHSPAPFLVAISSALILNGCQKVDPTVYECQTLLETINEIVVEAQTLTQDEQVKENQDPNLEVWLQAADVLASGSEAITELSISSPLLQTYQTQISEVYSEQSQATYEMIKAWQEKDLETAFAAQARTQEAGKLEQATGEALNQYCQAKKKEAESNS